MKRLATKTLPNNKAQLALGGSYPFVFTECGRSNRAERLAFLREVAAGQHIVADAEKAVRIAKSDIAQKSQ